MSIYDDLGDSGNFNNQDFRKQLEQYQQHQQHEQSMIGSNKFVEYQDYGDRVNQDDNDFFSNIHGIRGDGMNQGIDPSPISPIPPNDLYNQHYGAQSQIRTDIYKQNFSQMNQQTLGAPGSILYSSANEDDDFLKDSRTGLPYKQPTRMLQLEDDDIIQMHNNDQIKTGRFASNQHQDEFSHLGRRPTYPQNQMQGQTEQSMLDEGLDKFKNQNDQIQQLLMQLQSPFGQQFQFPTNAMPAQIQPQILPSGIHQQYHRAQSEFIGATQNKPQTTFEKLNKDNSILELAKMQHSGNSDNAINSNSNHSINEKDYFTKNTPVQNYNQHQRIVETRPQAPMMHGLQSVDTDFFMGGVNPTLVGNSLISYQKYMPPSMSPYEKNGQENIDQNMYQQFRNPQYARVENSFQNAQALKTAAAQQQMQQQPQPYNKQLSQLEVQKKEIMNKFDDIPIKELNKKEAYKQNRMDEEENEGQEEDSLSILERVDHPKWKVRMNAYKEINSLFQMEYSKECLKQKSQNRDQNEDEEEQRPFEVYGPVMQKIISDSNLVAQYEALNCLLSFVKYAPDIRSVIFVVHSILLEKVQHNKPNFRELTMKILLAILKKDKSQSLLPELLKRFKNKNTKIATFAMEVVADALKSSILVDEQAIKSLFKSTQDSLGHSNKELRDISIELMKQIYKLCEDDLSVFMKNIKNLRPVQQKEIKDLLADEEKLKTKVVLFKGQQGVTQTDGFSPIKAQLKDRQIEEDQDDNNVDQDRLDENQESDLNLLVPENFNEIPYLTQINVKKKAMESFNQELEKIIQRGSYQIANKDYSLIFNIVTHMLEDSNALVFMEAIKAVEYLCLVLGKNIKPQKLRQLISLLADKYKETKTGPNQAVNKALTTIIRKQNISLPQLIDYMINQVAFNNKNARVKQLLIEKLDITLIEDTTGIAQDEAQFAQIFKTIKEKIIGFIQKDTNAGVRDAAVSFLTTFKSYLQSNASVNEAINSLPKYRQVEINKLALERQISQIPLPVDKAQSEQKGSKSSERQVNSQASGRPGTDSADDFTYQGRAITGQYQIHLADIILSLKKVAQQQTPSSSSILSQRWEENIENLGEQGVKQSKCVIISCIHWLFTKHGAKIQDKAPLVEAILGLMKKIYCIERSVERDQRGQSKELDQATSIVLSSAQMMVVGYKTLESLFNVVLGASGSVSYFMEAVQKAIKQTFETQSQAESLNVAEFVYKWFGIKIELLMSKGLIFSDFEELRQLGGSLLDKCQEDQQRYKLSQILVSYKNAIIEAKRKMEYIEDSPGDQNRSNAYHQKDDDEEEEEKEIRPSNSRQAARKLSPERERVEPAPRQKSTGEQFVELIDSNFELGLQMLKSLHGNAQQLDQQTKEIIFGKLLMIVSTQCKNPVQQQYQAFCLKALLWMKEEIFGVEDCFKFSTNIMVAYASADLEGRDSSVELYLLNNWVKQLRLRDLIDRVSLASTLNESIFTSIFTWLMMHSLNGATSEWAIEDFRKISILLAKNFQDPQITEFFSQAVDKFGSKKVQEFMEIQLMHQQVLFSQFMDWFSQAYRTQAQSRGEPQTTDARLRLPQIVVDREYQTEQTGINESKRTDLKSRDLQVDESISSNRHKNTHSKLYQQLREKRKNSNQRRQTEDESVNKYDQIINRLENQLQNNQGRQSSNQKLPPQERQSDQKNFAFQKSKESGFSQSNRYQMRKTEEDEDLDDSLNKDSDSQVQLRIPVAAQEGSSKLKMPEMDSRRAPSDMDETESMLKVSTIQEHKWKDELERLEQEKQRIERERYQLLQVKNKETEEWRSKYDDMREEHEEVVSNLREANKCYLTQVSENEELKQQLRLMQDQHKMMMTKFEEFELKLNKQEETAIIKNLESMNKNKHNIIVQEQQLALIEKIFNEAQLQSQRGEEEFGIKRIQELLLNFNDKVDAQKIGDSLLIHYQQIKQYEAKMRLVKSLSQAIDNEDILFALPNESYKALLDFNLKVFAKEKALIEKNSIRVSTTSMGRAIASDQNEITVEVQKIVSKLLNSKEFTTSLVTLFMILKNEMPQDLDLELTEEQKHMLRVVMRCVSRIAKALHSENPDLVRAFDVLIEMQKIFLKNPPESLREDLPSLQELDSVYRGLKDVSDKLMELQPDKVIFFLDFIKDQPQNAFLRYMNQVMNAHRNKNRPSNFEDEEEIYEEGY